MDVRKQIEIKRQEMYDTVVKYGLTDERTIKISQELDALLNKIEHKKE